MKIDKYTEILQEWNDAFASKTNWKHVLALAPDIGQSERTENQIIYVTVRDEQGKPLLAEVRCYKLPEGSWTGEMDGTDERINEAYHTGDLEFTRFVTDETGYGVMLLHPGYYQIEVSKGSAYSVQAKRVHFNTAQLVLNYTLKPLPKKDWYAGDIHHHSVYSSSLYAGTDPVIETPVQIRDSMRGAGLDFGALSDHHNVLNHEQWQATETADFIPIRSKEISTGNGHVISLNVKKNADVIYRIVPDEQRTDEYARSEFVRITDEIRAEGGMPQLNHPRDPQTAISWNPKYMDIITIFESVEIWNGSKPMVYTSSSAAAMKMWIDMLENGVFIPGTTGSDTHNIRCDDYKYFYRDTLKLAERLRALEPSDPLRQDADVKAFLELCEQQLPLFEKWAKRNLSSGGVRTFVYTEKLDGPDSLVAGIRKGHLTLSDGPMLFPTMQAEGVNGGQGSAKALPGDIVGTPGAIDVNLTANRPLKTMRLLKRGRKMADYSLKQYEVKKDGYFDYSHTLTPQMLKELDMEWQGKDYLVMVAFDDCTNIAVANPFLVGYERARGAEQ